MSLYCCTMEAVAYKQWYFNDQKCVARDVNTVYNYKPYSANYVTKNDLRHRLCSRSACS